PALRNIAGLRRARALGQDCLVRSEQFRYIRHGRGVGARAWPRDRYGPDFIQPHSPRGRARPTALASRASYPRDGVPASTAGPAAAGPETVAPRRRAKSHAGPDCAGLAARAARNIAIPKAGDPKHVEEN